MKLFAAGSPRNDKSRLLKHAQMLHHAEARHVQFAFQLPQRASVPREKQVQKISPCRVGKRFEHPIVIYHPSNHR